MPHYGRGIAYASLNKLKGPNAQRELYHEDANRAPVSCSNFPNRIFDVLTAILDGEI
ncbi:hypothetical protein ACSS6W_007526 [Trichoderma asperelloides]